MFCPRLLREQSLRVVSRSPAQVQIFDPAAGGPWSEGVWPTDQTEGQESGDPGIHLVLVCSSAFPNGIHPAFLSSYPSPQTFAEHVLKSWLCAQHGGRYKALRHSLSPQGTHQWGSNEQTGHHRRLHERCSENVPDDQCVGMQSTVDIDVGSGVRQNCVQILKTGIPGKSHNFSEP